ncbi:MAG: PRC-barrel domain-containing protein [Ramlibacter sp.]
MLRNFNDFYGFTLAGSDGPIGEVRDCYFDDHAWTVRFLVVETGEWLGGRKVLIPPQAIHGLDWDAKSLSTSLTRAKVEASPQVDTTKPVSRQHEAQQFGFYGYPHYWGDETIQVKLLKVQRGDPHLRSCRAIERYHIHASDGDIGHVESLLVDDRVWTIAYLVVNTSDWCLGHQSLVAPASIADISWLEATVTVDLTRQAIRDAPPYDPNS